MTDMRLRVMLGTILYLVSIGAPVAWLYFMYGPIAAVDVGSAEDMAALVVAMAAAFVMGLAASKVVHQSRSSMLDELESALREIRASTGGKARRTEAGVS